MTVAHNDLDLNPGSHGCKPNGFVTELSCYMELLQQATTS